jgi:thioredoxin 1
MTGAIDVTEKNWEAEVLNSDVPVLVDFWGPACPPCRALAPTIDAVAAEMAGRAKVVKLNTTEAGNVAVRYGVMAIPVLMVFKDGQIKEQLIGGNQPKSRIIDKIEAHL